MNVYILFTTDVFKNKNTRRLRGIFSEEKKHLLDEAREDLITNKVVESEDEIEVICIRDGEWEPDGGYY